MFNIPGTVPQEFSAENCAGLEIMAPKRTRVALKMKKCCRECCAFTIFLMFVRNPLFLDPAVSTVESGKNTTFVEGNYNIQLQGFWQLGQWKAVCDSRIPFHVN